MSSEQKTFSEIIKHLQPELVNIIDISDKISSIKTDKNIPKNYAIMLRVGNLLMQLKSWVILSEKNNEFYFLQFKKTDVEHQYYFTYKGNFIRIYDLYNKKSVKYLANVISNIVKKPHFQCLYCQKKSQGNIILTCEDVICNDCYISSCQSKSLSRFQG